MKPNKEVSEEVIPQTTGEKVQEAMSNCLKEVGTARTSAITLQGLEYAENLSVTIKKHAEKIEKLYGEVQQKVKDSSTSEKDYQKVLKKIEEASQGTKKLQADHQLRFRPNKVAHTVHMIAHLQHVNAVDRD